MKNNLILIAVVTVISIAVICISIFLNKSGGDTSSDYVSSNTTDITNQTTEELPPDTEATEPVTQPSTEETTPASTEKLPPDTSDELPDENAEAIIGTAQALIGIDFYQGGTEPTVGFDNSGFIYYVLRENGFITCPRSIKEQTMMGTNLEYGDVKAGDLVYFYIEGDTEPGFGGIYIGGGKMITCQMPGTQVKEVDITTSYYRENFYCGVSII